MNEELMQRELPKWPQMLVTGKPVTPEQAKEIIRRTDTFFTSSYSGGNDRAWGAWARRTVGWPAKSNDYELIEKWKAAWGLIETRYVHNSWISDPFIYGPHGWCHPDGQIGFIDNVGKWPSVGDVFEDWRTLARAFQFIEIGVTLFDREESEEGKTPVVSMRVAGGSVELIDPMSTDVHAGHRPATRSHEGNIDMESAIRRLFDDSRERGIPRGWLEEWGARVDGGRR